MQRLIGSVLFVIFAALAFRLRVRDMDFAIEADFWSAIISSWTAYFRTFDPATLLPPTAQPYLDGINLPNALGAAAVRLAADQFPALRAYLPTEDAFNIAGVTAINILAYAMACMVFYAAVLRITRSVVIAVVAALAMFFSPQMLAINLIRVDYLMILPVMVMFYCSVRIAEGEAGLPTAVLLGVASAFAVTMKINGVFFLSLPVLAAAAQLIDTRRMQATLRVGAIAFAAFAACYAALMARYWYFLSLSGTVDLYRQMIDGVAQWSWALGSAGLYFNIERMHEHGEAFVVLYLACIVIVMIYARRDPVALFLSSTAILWSIAAAFTLKHERGGYHLVPIFLTCIAYVAGRTLAARPLLRYAGLALIGAPAAVSLVHGVAFYNKRVTEAVTESSAFQIVKRAPRAWIAAHVPRGQTVCVPLHSSWALPINDLGLKLIYGPLDLPYLDAARMAAFAPPALDALPSQCPLMVLEDFHINFFNAMFRRASPDMAQRWMAFYQALAERWPPRVFHSAVPSGGVTRVEIYDLR